ncbi:Disease resistance protein [Musa troglodytarum]|uniref:Disease resistance protein n=1 Tax=Musa troglodytarum TaxID=320322 RepID=A0A9E7JLY6_9LILI|nr:Disease resistance protein [Musa troglodytarum]URD85534.1 Disease resistance protein [Musa troglodytarum]
MLDVNPHLDLCNYQFRVHVDASRVRPGNVPAHSVAGLWYELKSRHRLVDLTEGEGSMGGGGGHGETYKGFTIHHPKRWHVVTGKGLCAIMWFWVLYRAKQDGPVVLGWRHPWEGHGDHSHDHGHEHEASH